MPVPTLPKGEYEVDTVDLAGVNQSEVVDDGGDVISATSSSASLTIGKRSVLEVRSSPRKTPHWIKQLRSRKLRGLGHK